MAYDTTSTWGYWNESETTSATTVADPSWRLWVGAIDTGTSTSTTGMAWHEWNQTIISREQIAEYNRQQAQQLADQKKRAEEWKVKHAAAKARAEQLLIEHLTPEQEKAWTEERIIFVTGQSGKRYKIKEGLAHNFFEVNGEGIAIKEFCVHIDCCPVADNVLAQKLALQCDEGTILKRANIWDLTRPERPLIQRSS